MADAARRIRAEPFFAGFGAAQRRTLAGCATIETYEAGRHLLRESDRADSFFVLLAGHVLLRAHVSHARAVPLETLGPHDALGWSWLVEPWRWHFDAEALEPTEALRFDAACLRAAMDADHDLGYVLQRRIIETMAHRLQATRMQGLDLYGNPAGER